MNIGEIIKNRRKELGMSAEEVADIIGASPATIYRYESNYITKMGIDKLTPIAKALRVSEAYLMGWTTDPNWRPESDVLPVSSYASLQLTTREEKVIAVFRRLSDVDQAKLIAYGEGLAAAGADDLNARLMEERRGPADIGLKYGCDLEGQLRKDANEIVRNEYENAAKSKSIAK